jgi:hypothetical protein
MLVLRLAVRAVRWRLGASITVFLVALIAVLSATIGPIYLHATEQVLLTDRLSKVSPAQVDLTVSRATRTHAVGMNAAQWTAPVQEFAAIAAQTRWFGDPVLTTQAAVTTRGADKATYATRVVGMNGSCAHLTFVAGRCPSDVLDAAVSQVAARTAGWHIGSMVTSTSSSEPTKVRVRVVGIYRPKNPGGRYWSPWHFFDGGGTNTDSELPRLDTIFISPALLAAKTARLTEMVTADVPLIVDHIRLDDVPPLRDSINTWLKNAATSNVTANFTPVKLSTSLVTDLDNLRHEVSLTRTLVTLATVQLAALAVCVLYAIVSATSTVHGPEVALAKLRGRSTPSVIVQGLLEPLLLVVTAAVAGATLAWVVTRLVAHSLLDQPVLVTYPKTALIVALITTAAAVGAAILAARRIVTAPIAALLRRGVDRAASPVGLAIADGVAVSAAVAGLVELSQGGVLDAGKPSAVAVVAPTLLAIALAVAGIRLLPLVGRSVLRATRESRRVATFLAARQIVRRSSGSRMPLVVAVALAITTFAIINAAVARTNRAVRAMNQAGAVRVLKVLPNDGLDFRAAVDRADPSGHDAMAAVVMTGASTQLLAIDTSRMRDIAAWRPDYSKSTLSHIITRLTPHTAPSVILAGRYVRVTVSLGKPRKIPVLASIAVVDSTHFQSTVSLGQLRPGTATYRGQLPSACARGCRLTQLTLVPPEKFSFRNRPGEITATVKGWSTAASAGGPWRPVSPAVDQPSEWRGAGQSGGTVGLTARDGGLRVDLLREPDGGDWPTLAIDDVPAVLPAVIGSQTHALYQGPAAQNITIVGLDSLSLMIDGSTDAVALPRLGRSGAMVDLSLALRSATENTRFGPTYEVWLSGSAPADIESKLAAQGMKILSSDDAAKYRSQLQRTGPAYADNLFVVAAAAATLLAIGATVLGGLVSARRRAYELAALEAVGVAPRVLRRAAAAEQGVLLGVGLVLGVVAGVFGAVLALPSTPFFVSTSVGPPVEHNLPWSTIGLLGAGLVVVLAVTCVLVARAVERQATPARLREAQG